jgi:hypothetical protein
MPRRPDHGQDATQELSSSQILRDLPPKPKTVPPKTVPPKQKGAVNDVSMWGRKVVGSEEFAPMPNRGAASSRRWLIGGVLGAAAVVGAGYAVLIHTDDEPMAPAMVVDQAPPPAPAPPVPTKPATPPPAKTAAAIATPVGAGSAALISTSVTPDAISSVAPVVKPPVAKKPAVKTAAAPATKRPALRKPPPKKAPPKRRR